MCTSVVEIVRAEGAGRGEEGWFPVTSAVVSYDHPHHALLEDAITIDFVNADLGPGARAAVELTLGSAKDLAAALARAIAGAEEMEAGRGHWLAPGPPDAPRPAPVASQPPPLILRAAPRRLPAA